LAWFYLIGKWNTENPFSDVNVGIWCSERVSGTETTLRYVV